MPAARVEGAAKVSGAALDGADHVLERIAFDARGEVGQITASVALAAKRLDRPMKLLASRRQGRTMRTYRADTRHRLRLGAATDGRLLAQGRQAVEATAIDEPVTVAGAEAVARLCACPNI